MDWSYLIEKIRTHGISFTPDPKFLEAVARIDESSYLKKTLLEAKPRAGVPESPDRHKAYLILVELVGYPLTPTRKEKYETAVALAPKSPALHLAYGGALLLVKDYPDAEVQERLSLELWPGDADAHVGLATALTGQDRDDEAIPEAREALRIYPNHKGGWVELGMALTRNRQFKEAVPVLREGTSRVREMPLLHKHLGLSLFNTGDIEGAISEYVLYLQFYPNDAEAHYHLGVAFRAQGHKDDAQAQFREAARLDPSNALFGAVANPSAPDTGPENEKGQRPDDGSVHGNVYANRFFQFSLKFPEDWVVMGEDAQRNAAKLGGEMLAGSDPTLRDAQQAAAAHSYQLLFITPGKSGARTLSTRSIQITALDTTVAPEVASGEDFLKTRAKFFQRLQTPLQATGPPVVMSVGGRRLWRMDLTFQVDSGLHWVSEIVTIEKGYLLLFVLSSPDRAGLEGLLQTMNSLHFSPDSN